MALPLVPWRKVLMAIIETKNLWKEYGDQVVLERLNAHVQELALHNS